MSCTKDAEEKAGAVGQPPQAGATAQPGGGADEALASLLASYTTPYQRGYAVLKALSQMPEGVPDDVRERWRAEAIMQIEQEPAPLWRGILYQIADREGVALSRAVYQSGLRRVIWDVMGEAGDDRSRAQVAHELLGTLRAAGLWEETVAAASAAGYREETSRPLQALAGGVRQHVSDKMEQATLYAQLVCATPPARRADTVGQVALQYHPPIQDADRRAFHCLVAEVGDDMPPGWEGMWDNPLFKNYRPLWVEG